MTENASDDARRDAVTDEALDWHLRLIAGPVDAATLRAFEAWRDADPLRREISDRLQAMQAMPSLRLATERLAAPRNRPRRVVPMALAASLLLAIGLWQGPGILLHMRADYVTATGERQRILLPDGSTMVMNTESAVALDFDDTRRQVRLLSGEAYFDVVHGPRPFSVIGEYSETLDIGTAFSVHRTGDEDVVVLDRGAVVVTRLSEQSDRATLSPGDRVVARSDSLLPARGTESGNSLAWIDGRVIFDGTAFADALDSLRRYFPGTVVVATGRLDDLRMSGSYDLDRPEDAIRTLAQAAGGRVHALPGRVLLIR